MTVSIIGIIISIFSLFISSLALYFTWLSNQGKIILNDIKILANRNENNLLIINIIFLFKNIGKEDIKINNIKIGTINIDKDSNFELINNDEIINIINRGNIFNYSITFSLNIPNYNNENISILLPSIIKKQAIFLKLYYDIKSFGFIKRKKYFYHYMLFTGGSGLSHLEKKDFDLIKNKIPKDFIL